jgi:hypothetical protein
MRKYLLVGLVGLVVVGCGGDKKKSGGDDSDTLQDVVLDTGGDEASGCADYGGLDTVSEVTEVAAGTPVVLSCVVPGCDGLADSGFSLAVAGAGSDVDVDGLTVTFSKAGTYEAACQVETETGTFVDESPISIVVVPGKPAEVTTTIDVTEVVAGTQVSVLCAAQDALGNAIYGPFELVITPEEGVKIVGALFTPTTAVKHMVTCYADSIYEGNPVKVNVIPAMPSRIVTGLSSTEAEVGKKVNISCQATDKFDNHVAGFPMVVYVPPELTLAGLAISGTLAGFYEVKCVPQAQEWALFELFPQILTIVPGAPAVLKLTLVPDKPVYKKMDKVLFQPAVRDMYGNLIPDPTLNIQSTTEEGLPTDGLKELQPWNYKFLDNGTYKFVVMVATEPSVKAERLVHVDGDGPLLSVDYPGRGATISDKPSVTVMGTVSDDVTGIETFTLNGDEVDVALDNTFSHIVIANHAVNLVIAEAMDVGGESSRTTRAFAWSDRFFPATGSDEETYVPGGLRIFLSEQFVDDGDHNPEQPNDLATLFEVVLGGMNFGALIPNPIYNANNYKVFIKNVSLDSPTVGMDLIEGGMTMDITLKNLSADIEAIGSCSVLGVDLCPDVDGTLSIDSINLYATLKMDLDNGMPKAALTEFYLGLTDLNIDLSGIGSLLEPIINGIIGIFEQQVESALESQLKGMLPGLLNDVFSQLMLDENITIPGLVDGAEPVNMNLKTRYSALDFSPSGISMSFATRASTTQKVMHQPLGSLGRGNCAGPDAEPYEIPKDSVVAVAIGDDLLNQILFTVWWGGALNLTLDETVLGDIMGDLEGYGLTEPVFTLDFFLAPMLSDCNELEILRFGIGDLYLQGNFKMLGVPMSMGMFATATGDAEIELVEGDGDSGPAFSISLAEIGTFEYEIVSVTEGYEGLIPIIEELLQGEMLQDALAGIAGQSFGGLQLPEFDLGTLVPGIPGGTVLKIVPTGLERVFGFTELTGVLE